MMTYFHNMMINYMFVTCRWFSNIRDYRYLFSFKIVKERGNDRSPERKRSSTYNSIFVFENDGFPSIERNSRKTCFQILKRILKSLKVKRRKSLRGFWKWYIICEVCYSMLWGWSIAPFSNNRTLLLLLYIYIFIKLDIPYPIICSWRTTRLL